MTKIQYWIFKTVMPCYIFLQLSLAKITFKNLTHGLFPCSLAFVVGYRFLFSCFSPVLFHARISHKNILFGFWEKIYKHIYIYIYLFVVNDVVPELTTVAHQHCLMLFKHINVRNKVVFSQKYEIVTQLIFFIFIFFKCDNVSVKLAAD